MRVSTARGPEFGECPQPHKKTKAAGHGSQATFKLPHAGPVSLLTTATRNPHPGHPQEPMEHGREPHAHQVSETSHLCAALPRIWEHLPPQSTCSLGSGLLLPLTQRSLLLLLLTPCRAGAGWGLVSGGR